MKEIIKKLTPAFLLQRYYFLLAWLGSFWYGHPSERLVVIGVTGTNGKSTTVELISAMLKQGGFLVSSLSSIRFELPGKVWPNDLKITMPGRFRLQKFLFQALQAGSTHAVIEVTSEGVKIFRHRFIHFDVAVLTNLTPEHIESHGSLEAYQAAKEKLFRKVSEDPEKRFGGKVVEKVLVLNNDDAFGRKLSLIKTDKLFTYSLEKEGAGITVDQGSRWALQEIVEHPDGMTFTLGGRQCQTYLLGKFNIANLLAASATSLSQGVKLEEICEAVKNIKGIAGRLERISSPKGFEVIVDYAHTPDALQKVYQTVSLHLKPKNLICVLGSAGGGRDRWKRKEMGILAGKYCQKVFVTNEDPYDEDPQAIIDEVAAGVDRKETIKVSDRREAIQKALQIARFGDVVVCTGKGSEPWVMGPHGQKTPWNEKEVVKQELASPSPR